nr:hypothetical protein [Tanacetum cinerariifolium]
QRLIAVDLIADDVRALLGNHQFGLTVANTPAIELTELDGFDFWRRHRGTHSKDSD